MILTFRGPLTNAQPGTAHSDVLEVCGSEIKLDISDGELDLSHGDLRHWVQEAADSVSTYYGRFPVSRTRLLIVPVPNQQGVLQATTWGTPAAHHRVSLGQHTTAADLRDDWEMTHEFVHTAFPQVADNHHWIEEGLATYIEPIARVQNGTLSEEKVWADMIRDMPKGEPQTGDRGLDRTHTWARTYWGGALFFLVADVAIHQRTNNEKGLQDALRAVLDSGRSIEVDSTPENAFAIGDRATGVPVLQTMYAQQRYQPVTEDLTALWHSLGVRASGAEQVVYDDSAPLAAVRNSIFKKRVSCLTSKAGVQR